MTGVTIRPARLDDAAALQQFCYPEATVDDVRDYVAWCLRPAHRDRILRLVGEVDGQAIANVQLTVWEQTGEIGSLVVAEAFRRRGIARQLLAAAITQARARGLAALEIWVRADQPAILAFYEDMGFRQDGQNRKGLFRSSSHEPVGLLQRLL